MFFKQIRRNAAKNRKGNGLFFGSLVIAIVAFYTLLSLGEQDVMQFLATIESDAVRRLMQMLPVVYAVSLFFVFFLVYFACRYQADSRRREMGMYLMLGMKRSRLFGMLFGETLWNSMVSLIAGIPIALFLTEGISLATAKIVGLGIIGHHFSLSLGAIVWTVCGFLLVQLFSMLMICISLGRTEPADFFRTGDTKKQAVSSAGKSTVFLCAGLALLVLAYYLGIFRLQALDFTVMLAIVLLGIPGTFLLYRGMGGFLGLRIRRQSPGATGLSTFTARQVQENVLSQHRTLAVSSLLLMTALACVSFGIAMGMIHSAGSRSVDFSLFGGETQINAVLAQDGVGQMVEDSYPLYLSHVKDGYFRDQENAFDTQELEDALINVAGSENIRENLYIEYVIAVSSYNRILKDMGKEEIDLSGGKVAMYSSLATEWSLGTMMQEALGKNISIGIDGTDHALLPALFYDNIVADRAITLYLALIVPDEIYSALASKPVPYCRNMRLSDNEVKKTGLMQTVQKMGALLAASGIKYDSYLAGIGRSLFYTVAASYLTIYLGILFWLIANTVIGMKYLIGQRRTKRRYETLTMLGADMLSMRGSVRKQIDIYFSLVLVTALASGVAAVFSMFTSFAMLPMGVSKGKTILLSFVVLAAFAGFEALYIRIVKRTACREISWLEISGRR